MKKITLILMTALFLLMSNVQIFASSLYYYDVFNTETTYTKHVNMYGKPDDFKMNTSIPFGCMDCLPVYEHEGWIDSYTGEPILFTIINGSADPADYSIGTIIYKINNIDNTYYDKFETKEYSDGKKYFDVTEVDFIEDGVTKGTIKEQNKVLDDNYPVNGVHTDGYYYVRKSVVPEEPTEPEESTLIGISINTSSISIQEGDTKKITVVANYSDGSKENVSATWSVSNSKIASVSSSGTVTGKEAGSTTATATYNGKTDQVTITVTAAKPPPEPYNDPYNLGSVFDWSFFWGQFGLILNLISPFLMITVAVVCVGLLIAVIIYAIRRGRTS